MTKDQKNASGSAQAIDPMLTRRYDSIAEIKRAFFPNAAAEDEAEAAARFDDNGHEVLMDEFFGPNQQSAD